MNKFPPIENLLVHRANMLLLKEVAAFSNLEITCRAVPDGSAWYARDRASGMPAWVGIELMAQAIAAHVSLRSVKQGGGPRPGVLLGTRDYQTSCAAFPQGETLAVRAVETFRSADGLASYDCEILSCSGERIASAKLNVYEPPDFEQFILGTQS